MDSTPAGVYKIPNLFGQVLEQILQDYQPEKGMTLVQYVNDLLIAGKEEESVRRGV